MLNKSKYPSICLMNCNDSWNLSFSEKLFQQIAEIMASDGWKDVGYASTCSDLGPQAWPWPPGSGLSKEGGSGWGPGIEDGSLVRQGVPRIRARTQAVTWGSAPWWSWRLDAGSRKDTTHAHRRVGTTGSWAGGLDSGREENRRTQATLVCWDRLHAVYAMCISRNKPTSYLLLCLSLNSFCTETQRTWASVSPDPRGVILIKRPLVQVPVRFRLCSSPGMLAQIPMSHFP